MNRLSLKQTEMQGELSAKEEQCSDLKLEVNSLNERCDVYIHIYVIICITCVVFDLVRNAKYIFLF